MKKHTRLLCIIVALAAVFATFGFAVACDDGETDGAQKTYTLTFVTGEGGTVIEPIKAKADETITPPADPTREGYEFAGWYLTSDFSGSKVNIPTTMPSENRTYYANFVEPDNSVKLVYEFNLPSTVFHRGEVTDTVGEDGDVVTVKNGEDYLALGYKFLGWSTEKNGPVRLFLDDKRTDNEYAAGDKITLGERDVVLYAQWYREYTDARGKSDDVIYVYDALVGKGKGAAMLVREGQEDKLGFVTSSEDTEVGYPEFTFMFDASEGGDIIGRLYDDGTYACPDLEEKGVYVLFDHALNSADLFFLALDGYEYATLSEAVGSQTAVRCSGYYAFDEQYNDYVFEYMDGAGNVGVTTFIIERGEVDTSVAKDFDGFFRMLGDESGEFLLYDNGELCDYKLALNGYGYAKVYEYDAIADETVLVGSGTYHGTDKHEDYYGEWQFTPAAGSSISGFKFVLNEIYSVSGNISVYVEYNPEYDVTLTAQEGSGTLSLNGYGVGVYSDGGVTYGGNVIVTGSNVKFATLYIDGEEAGEDDDLLFTVDFAAGTFKLNEEGFIIDDDGVLTGYMGKSRVIVIPDGVTKIADGAFNYVNTDVSIVSVTIPASVTEIGSRAFENNGTLRRAIFLSNDPVDIDFTSETANQTDPFRWPAGGFIIVVPEGTQDTYKAAWGNKYSIKGSVEVTTLPEFEIEDGVLVAYNKQEGSSDELSIVMPDGVVAIAEKVFRGADYIVSVDFNNVTIIGNDAFEGCINLTTAIMPNVEQIGEGAFFGCYSLVTSGNGEKIELPAIVTVGANAFQSCYALRRVVLGEGLTEIGDMAFYESQVFDTDPPLFIELAGSNAPEMGAKIFVGCIAVRIQVKGIDVAFACYRDGSWTAYCTHLYIPSGEEAGKYMSGSTLLSLDGRAELQGSVVMLYEVDGTTITFYEYDRLTATFATIEGTIEGGVITFTREGVEYEFLSADGEITYRSDDGKYTLVCNPLKLDPEYYEGYSGTSSVLFNATEATLEVKGYGLKIIGFTDTDGVKYDFTLTFGKGARFTYEKSMSPYFLYDVTSADGSNLTLHFTKNYIYVLGTLNQKIEGTEQKVFSSNEDYYYALTKVSDNVYTFTSMYLNDKYLITLTFADGDMTSFTYTCEKQ